MAVDRHHEHVAVRCCAWHVMCLNRPLCVATLAPGVTVHSVWPAGYFKATKPKKEKGKSEEDQPATCVSAAYAKAVEQDLSSRPAYQQVTVPGPLKGRHSSMHAVKQGHLTPL